MFTLIILDKTQNYGELSLLIQFRKDSNSTFLSIDKSSIETFVNLHSIVSFPLWHLN